MGDTDDMCCMAIVDLDVFSAGELAAVARRCGDLGWETSLIGRKLYAFPVGFGKEHAAAYVAERISALAGAAPVRLAAGDTEHDRRMLADADHAWVPAGSELALSAADSGFVTTREPGHAAAAQITADWLAQCRAEAAPVS
jgi:hydroxymethylpyrimidine pyrophosphatase-like HAD family hydrolase